MYVFFFFNDTATTEIYTRSLVGSVQMCIRDSFYAAQIDAAKADGLLLSLHLKATMMKVSDPVMFLSLIHISEPTRPY